MSTIIRKDSRKDSAKTANLSILEKTDDSINKIDCRETPPYL